MTKKTTCPDCGVGIGEPHLEDCYVAMCSLCAMQRIKCECSEWGESVWTGEWPETTWILDQVAQQLSRTAMSCYEALQDYWCRNDEGFEAMKENLERSIRLLGYPLPNYAERDEEERE